MTEYIRAAQQPETILDAGIPNGWWKPHALISYASNPRGRTEITRKYRRAFGLLMLDSGAYSAFTIGKPIQLDNYCSFLEAEAELYDQYVALDVIGDTEATRANYAEMLRRGFHPLPVYQLGAPEDDFRYYADHSEIVGVGGLLSSRLPVTQRINYFRHIKRLADECGVGVHWFGVTTPYRAIHECRPAQIDSSLHVQATKNGAWLTWNGYRLVNLNAKFYKNDHKTPKRWGDAVKRGAAWVGIPRSQITWDAAFIEDLNARSVVKLAQLVERENGTKYVLGGAAGLLQLAAAAIYMQRQEVISRGLPVPQTGQTL